MKKIRFLALMMVVMAVFSACIAEEEPTLPYSFEVNDELETLRNGRLIYTLNRVWTIDNISELPEGGGIPDNGYCYYSICEPRQPDETVHYPECVLEDGSFKGGVYMLMMEVTVSSEDAEAWTTEDVNDNGYARGMFSDPYIFSIRGGVGSLRDSNRLQASFGIAYFSALNEIESPLIQGYAFRLCPGETRTFVIGYFVCYDNITGAPVEPSELILRNGDEYVPIGKCFEEGDPDSLRGIG